MRAIATRSYPLGVGLGVRPRFYGLTPRFIPRPCQPYLVVTNPSFEKSNGTPFWVATKAVIESLSSR